MENQPEVSFYAIAVVLVILIGVVLLYSCSEAVATKLPIPQATQTYQIKEGGYFFRI